MSETAFLANGSWCLTVFYRCYINELAYLSLMLGASALGLYGHHLGRSAWLNIRHATTTGFPKSVCQEDRRWQILRSVNRGPDIVEMVSMECALDIDVLQFSLQSREMLQNTLIFLGPL